MANQKQNFLHTAGKVTGATGVATLNDGGFTPARTGAGVYTLTLNVPIDATERVTKLTARGTGVSRIINVVDVSDTVIQVEVFTTAPAAADGDFDFAVLRVAG